MTFDFPGWVAEVDETAVSITPSDPEGLITFPVPAGTHTIDIKWQSTPLRTTLVVLSVLSLLGVVSVFGLYTSTANSQRTTDNGQQPTIYGALFILAILLIGLKFLVIDNVESPLRRISTPPVTNSLVLQGGEMRMDGFNLTADVVESGGTFDIDMAWTAVSGPSSRLPNQCVAGWSRWTDLERLKHVPYPSIRRCPTHSLLAANAVGLGQPRSSGSQRHTTGNV